MPTYRFRCRAHGDTHRNVPYSQRESQLCNDCGELLDFVFTPSKNIIIPEGFRAGFEPVTPTDPTQQRTWEREGIRPAGRR